MSRKRTGLRTPLSYMGVNAPTPGNTIVHFDRAPTERDHYEFNIGDIWVDISRLKNTPPERPRARDIWMLVSKNKQVSDDAVWVHMNSGSIEFLVDDDNNPVGPNNAGEVNIQGGFFIDVVGDPNTNTLTINASPNLATQFTTEDGIAIPDNGNLNVLGDDEYIETSGFLDTIEISLRDNVAS